MGPKAVREGVLERTFLPFFFGNRTEIFRSSRLVIAVPAFAVCNMDIPSCLCYDAGTFVYHHHNSLYVILIGRETNQ